MQDIGLQEAITKLKSAFEKASNQALLDKTGIGASHFRLLKTVAHLDSPTQQEVAITLGQSQAAVSRHIKTLVDDGLVSLRVNPDNRREHILNVTAKGQRLARKAAKIAHSNIQTMLSGLDDKTLRETTRLLNKIADHVQNIQ